MKYEKGEKKKKHTKKKKKLYGIELKNIYTIISIIKTKPKKKN